MLNDKLTYISLFSSAGVGCYGFKQENFECIATNEILPRRLEIQKLNNKCKFESGYICGDIKSDEIKKQIYAEIEKYKRLGNDKIDVIIATPPCQGMSVANHKKKNNEIDRNSLVVESVEIIKNLKPRFFILENVSAFYKTGCFDKNGNLLEIGELIQNELGKSYSIYNEIINFKNYGANSSRTRTLVVGVCNELSNFISPIELFPDFCNEKSLKSVIGDLKSLDWGKYDKNDFFHSFRIYPKHMREWIKDLKQGESAFDNTDDTKKPHQIINGKIVLNQSKNGDKYTRQNYDKVAPCIHTRNDQLASQNTIHPIDDRVFSIRELMLMMNIPSEFKWLKFDLDYLNSLSQKEKEQISKKEEMNIRQSIGEAVPTVIFRQIAKNIKNFMSLKRLSSKEIKEEISKFDLSNLQNLKKYILENKDKICLSSLSAIAEMANSKRENNSAFFTNKFIINEIIKDLPNFKKDEIYIVEPSVGCGNFLPLIFKKYANVKKVKFDLIDIDENMLEIVQSLYANIPKNFKLNFICQNFLDYKKDNIDLIIGNPPFGKLQKNEKIYLKGNFNKQTMNLSELFLEYSLNLSDNVSLIMPKNLLNTSEFELTRELLSKFCIKKIIDFGENGFSGVLIETINILIDKNSKSKNTQIFSMPQNINLLQNKDYIFDKNLPYWVIYRNNYFDEIFSKMDFDIFNAFRDRQLTNSNTSFSPNSKSVRVLKSRNINDDGSKILNIKNYDSYISKTELKKYKIGEFLENDSVYLTPNMTYNPRVIKKEKGCVVNGSVAILIPKYDFILSQKQLKYISSDEFRKFYKIARNYQTRTLNIDNTSCFWFGALKD